MSVSDWPPSSASERTDWLGEEAVAWCSQHGLVKATEGPKRGLLEHMPVSLYPSPLPGAAYDQGKRLAAPVVELVHAAANDREFLRGALEGAAKHDDFTRRLWQVMDKAEGDQGSTPPAELGIHRIDFMLDEPTQKLLMVEANTISASFYGLGPIVTGLQSYIAARGKTDPPGEVPANEACEAAAEGLAEAWRSFGAGSAAVLVVVQPNESNFVDQRRVTDALWNLHGVDSERWDLASIRQSAELDEKSRLYVGGRLFSVVYFRSGIFPLWRFVIVAYGLERKTSTYLHLWRSAA